MSSRFKVQDQTGRIVNGPDLLNGLLHWFRGTPTASAQGYEKGCLAYDITNGLLYINTGTTTSAVWQVFTSFAAAIPTDLSTLTATAAEINRSSDVSTRLVTVAAATTTLTLTEAAHEGKTLVLAPTGGLAITPIPATGSGGIYTFAIAGTVTGGSLTIDFKAANASDVINGTGYQDKDGTGLTVYSCSTNTNLITLNGTTTGGVIGDIIQIQDIATHQWLIRIFSTQATGTVASPFSNH